MVDIDTWQVLIVESKEGVLKKVTDIFGFYNIPIVTITLNEFPDTLRLMNPTLILVDLRLSLEQCYQLIAESKESMVKITVISIGDHYSPAISMEAIRSGFDAYFPQPKDPTSFMRELERLISMA